MVAPSLPGFGFSSAPQTKGFGIKEMGKTLNSLMLSIGYSTYVAQGECTEIWVQLKVKNLSESLFL